MEILHFPNIFGIRINNSLRTDRIKCKLGYAELHKPAPGFGPGETVGSLFLFSRRDSASLLIFRSWWIPGRKVIRKESSWSSSSSSSSSPRWRSTSSSSVRPSRRTWWGASGERNFYIFLLTWSSLVRLHISHLFNSSLHVSSSFNGSWLSGRK